MTQALLWRQWLMKTRAAGSTVAELVSPVLLICMLVVAYGLVHPDHHPARVIWLTIHLLESQRSRCPCETSCGTAHRTLSTNPQVYAGDTAELLHNMTRDALGTSAALDLQLCAAYLQSGSGGNSAGAGRATARQGSRWQGHAGAVAASHKY